MRCFEKLKMGGVYGVALLWFLGIPFIAAPFMLLSKKHAFWWPRFWSRGILRIFGIKLHVEGLENWDPHKAYVVAPNHCSLIDVPVMGALDRSFRWVSKKEVVYIPFLGWAARAVVFFVERKKGSRDLQVLRAVEKGVREGESVLMFPEGTRSTDGKLLGLKKGPFRVAQNTGVPLLPVAICGSFEMMPKGTLPASRHHHITVRVGEPIHCDPAQDLSHWQAVLSEKIEQLSTLGG